MLATTLALVLSLSTPQVSDLLPDTTAFLETGSYPFRTGTAVVLDTARDLAFVGAGSGVLVVDISDPTRPVVLSDRIRGSAMMVKDMFLDGTRLYVALFSFSSRPDLPRDVEVWDVSVPASPLLLGGVNLRYGAQCICARGDTLLVGSYRSLFSYDISNLENPVLLESLGQDGFPEQIMVRDTLAFVSQSVAGVAVYDVRSLAHPQLLAQWGPNSSFPGIEVAGSRLYYASSWGGLGPDAGLRIYDITDPLQGRLLGAFDTVRTGAYRVTVRDTVAFVTYARNLGFGISALKAVSVTDPSAPRQLSAYGGKCLGVALRETLAFVAFEHRFEILNIADPSRPTRVGSLPLGLAGQQLTVDQGLAYSVGGSFSVLALAAGPDIELAGALDLGGMAYRLAQQDTIALVELAADTGGWRVDVVGLSDATRPHRLSTLPGPRIPYGLTLRDSLAFVSGDSSLHVYSLADPRAPVQVGSLDVPMSATRLIVRDTVLYANGGPGMQAFNIADPRSPALVAETSFDVQEFVVQDTWLYAACLNWPRFAVISIADPAVFQVVRANAGASQVEAMSSSDTLLACANNLGSYLHLLSTAVPDSPVVLGQIPLTSPVLGVVVVRDTLYTSHMNRYRLVRVPSGIELEPIGAAKASRLRVWPSPVNRELNLAGCNEATLHDASGRRVLDLKAGPNDVRHVAPGVYFVRRGSGVGREASNVARVVITR